MKINYRFNRRETLTNHEYFNLHGSIERENYSHTGYLKAKLIHGNGFSIICPDFIFLGIKAEKWIQPFQFFPPVLLKISKTKACFRFFVDITFGHTILIQVDLNDYINSLADGSVFYKCTIFGPKNLFKMFTGESVLVGDVPHIYLFHHTTHPIKKIILKSQFLFPSSWNIQGSKKLKNIGYAYFTPLDKIRFEVDLKLIAMSANGKLHFLIDNAETPSLSQLPISIAKKEVLELEVYRSSTIERCATIRFRLPAHFISSPHIWRHTPFNSPVYYEIASPFIYRVPILPNDKLFFNNQLQILENNLIKSNDYIVIGDARNIKGLAAPFDEENTKEICKIEFLESGQEIINYWFEHGNTDQFSNKDTNLQEFESL